MSFWRLSYRRKFIRTIWGGLAGVAMLVWLQVNGETQQTLEGLGASNGDFAGWLLTGIVCFAGVLQTAYYWRRWNREASRPA